MASKDKAPHKGLEETHMTAIKIKNGQLDELLHNVEEVKRELANAKKLIIKGFGSKTDADTYYALYATIHLCLTDLERVTRDQVLNGYEMEVK